MEVQKHRALEELAGLVDISRAKISDIIFDRLRTAIIRGDLKSGDRLSEEEVAARVNSSRTPVREAFRRLESEGLIRHFPRRGVEVIGITHEDFMEIFEIRRLLEPEAVRMAAERATPDTVQTLECFMSEMKNAVKVGDQDSVVEYHEKWTVAILGMCGNKRLVKLLTTYAEYIRKSSMVALKVQGEQAARIHQQLTEAIKHKDSERARTLYADHLDFAYQTAKAAYQDEGGRGIDA